MTSSDPKPTTRVLDEAAAELRASGLLTAEHGPCVRLPGGTDSVVGVVSRGGRPDLVIKAQRPGQVAGEALFLRAYAASPLLPRLRHVDPARRYLVYDYLPGERPPNTYASADKAASLRTFARDLLRHYRSVAELASLVHEDGAGDERLLPWLTAPQEHTWEHELARAVANARRRFGDFLPAEADGLVMELARDSLRRTKAHQLVLLHGDPGPHNFLFDGPTLTGVIDPGVHVGTPIYDIARAFFAWPPDFAPATFARAAEALDGYVPAGDRQLAEDAIPLLYGQTVACLWHHPEDLAAYQDAWRRWATLMR